MTKPTAQKLIDRRSVLIWWTNTLLEKKLPADLMNQVKSLNESIKNDERKFNDVFELKKLAIIRRRESQMSGTIDIRYNGEPVTVIDDKFGVNHGDDNVFGSIGMHNSDVLNYVKDELFDSSGKEVLGQDGSAIKPIRNRDLDSLELAMSEFVEEADVILKKVLELQKVSKASVPTFLLRRDSKPANEEMVQ